MAGEAISINTFVVEAAAEAVVISLASSKLEIVSTQ